MSIKIFLGRFFIMLEIYLVFWLDDGYIVTAVNADFLSNFWRKKTTTDPNFEKNTSFIYTLVFYENIDFWVKAFAETILCLWKIRTTATYYYYYYYY